MLPCAVSVEKEGSITNSGRWMQWRYKAAEPPGTGKPDGEILMKLSEKTKMISTERRSTRRKSCFPGTDFELEMGLYHPRRVRFPQDGQGDQRLFPEGCDRQGETVQERAIWCPALPISRLMVPPAAPTGFTATPIPKKATWPPGARGRNPASDSILNGPGAGRSTDVSFTTAHRWTNTANPGTRNIRSLPGIPVQRVEKADGSAMCPTADGLPCSMPDGTPNPKTKYPFIMKPEGHAHIFGPGRADGPFPEHYEPIECPVEKNLFSSQLVNPVAATYTIRTWISTKPAIPGIPLWAPLTGFASTGRPVS